MVCCKLNRVIASGVWLRCDLSDHDRRQGCREIDTYFECRLYDRPEFYTDINLLVLFIECNQELVVTRYTYKCLDNEIICIFSPVTFTK